MAFSIPIIPPYDIQKTNWLSEEELQSIHHCADATENSGTVESFVILYHKY